MALRPIGGEIAAQVLNDNFSYLDTQMLTKDDIYYANVLDFGADPTGVADSTAAIQAAIDVLSNGGTLMIPKGTYLISATLKFDVRGITIRGEGKSSVLKADASLTGAILQSLASERTNVTYLDNVIIERLNFDGQGQDISGFKATGFTRGCVVRDCYYVDCANAGIELAGSWSFSLERNNINGYDKTGHGMLLGAVETGDYNGSVTVNQAYIAGNTIRNCNTGIRNDYGSVNTIIGNTVEMNNRDYLSLASSGNVIIGNYFELASNRSFDIGGTSSNNMVSDTLITGNFFNAADEAVAEIYINSISGSRIIGNHFHKTNRHLYAATGSSERIYNNYLDFPSRSQVYNESELDYLTNTIYFNDTKFRYVRTSRLEVAANIGFFGKQEIGQQSVSGSTAEEKVDSLIAALRAYGLIRE